MFAFLLEHVTLGEKQQFEELALLLRLNDEVNDDDDDFFVNTPVSHILLAYQTNVFPILIIV